MSIFRWKKPRDAPIYLAMRQINADIQSVQTQCRALKGMVDEAVMRAHKIDARVDEAFRRIEEINGKLLKLESVLHQQVSDSEMIARLESGNTGMI